MDRIASGVGKHFIHNLKAKASVAVLYSQASIRAAFFENRREEHSKLRDKYIQLLHHLGYAFDFVSYEQLADGTFESRGYKALILADATAMSDAEVEAVERFAAKGGAVLAEGVPATREGNCRKRVQSPLARFVLIPKVDVSYLKALEYPAEPENAALIAAEQDRLESALAKAGVNPPRIVMSDSPGGGRFRLAETYAREGKGVLFWGVISNDRQDHVIDFSFPKKGHLYDLAAGKYIGFGDRFTLPFAAGRPYAFELMDERPAISGLTAEDGKIRIAYSKHVDSVVYLRMYDPKGQEVEHYSRKLVVKNGVAETTVPFALSDPKGEWRVVATDYITGKTASASFRLGQ